MTNPYIPKGSFQFDPNRPIAIKKYEEIPSAVAERVAAFCASCPRRYVKFSSERGSKNWKPLFNSPSQPVEVCVLNGGSYMSFIEKDFLAGFEYNTKNGLAFEMNCVVTLSEEEMTVMLYFTDLCPDIKNSDQTNIYMLYFYNSIHGAIDVQQPPQDTALRSFIESIAFESAIMDFCSYGNPLPEQELQNHLSTISPNVIYVEDPPLHYPVDYR